MMAERTATATWSGTLEEGGGEVSLETSKLLVSAPVSWQARVEQPDGHTSPEELLAGAQAACYAMALSNVLGQQGHRPDRIEVRATCSFDKVGEAFAVTEMKLHVRAALPGMDEEAFQQAARAGEQGCPLSNAIRGNVNIQLDAALS
jgi:lipoyl-dependent peroxiredoxin